MRCWLQITSGRGPDECGWVVAQLVRYLITIAPQHQADAKLLEAIPGNQPNTLSSALLGVEGDDEITAFVSSWEGSVQWVGTSIFRPNHKRKNWFVSVKVLEPIMKNQWNPQDVKIERMKSSGPGGQHANKTESAIRVTHIPTGLSAVSQEERSQYLNRKLAFARLGELLQQQENQARLNFDQNRWNSHNTVERGNAVHVFEGKKFRLKR